MNHSVSQIAEEYSILSDKRGDEKRFNESNFNEYARNNMSKYNIFVSGDTLMVSSWYSNDLINDYRNQIK